VIILLFNSKTFPASMPSHQTSDNHERNTTEWVSGDGAWDWCIRRQCARNSLRNADHISLDDCHRAGQLLLGCCCRILPFPTHSSHLPRSVILSHCSCRIYADAHDMIGLGMGGWYSLAGTTSITHMFNVRERGRRVGI
jgi:hypothetical protein